MSSSACAMDLSSLEKQEMNSSPSTDHMNADSSRPENTWQQIFKSYSNQHHGFVDSIEQATVLLKKYGLEATTRSTTKFSCYKSDKLFGSGGKTFFYSQGHTRSRWEISPHCSRRAFSIFDLENITTVKI